MMRNMGLHSRVSAEGFNDLPIVVVDDDELVLSGLRSLLARGVSGSVRTLQDGEALLSSLAEERPAVILLDLYLPGRSGLEILQELALREPDIPVIVMTGAGEVETAVECMKAGAFDFLAKPVERARLLAAVAKAMEVRLLRLEVDSLRSHLLTEGLCDESAFCEIVTVSAAMRAIFRYIEAVAPSPQAVLITGETGTGKELAARAIHRSSGRKGNFVAVNAAGLDDEMFSDTLFGHRRGAFSGASTARAGLIEQAAGGTLFLDEIGDLKESSQVKLLRLLQERSYYPLGADLPRSTDARVVAATNRNLEEAVRAGRFRADLYYRLKAHLVELPPLRERREDIPLLLDHFIGRAAQALGKGAPMPDAALPGLLTAHDFPGNVRELEGMVFDALARHRSGPLTARSFNGLCSSPSRGRRGVGIVGSVQGDEPIPTLKEAEERLVETALARAGNNQRVAAGMLGITRQALNKRLTRRKNPPLAFPL